MLFNRCSATNPLVDEAHHRVTPPGFKYVVTEFACRATGGPQHNSGRSMYDSHVHLRLTNKEWTAFMHDLDQSLYKFRVPEAERAEFIALIESAKPDMGLIDAS
ncbi:MAG TPA: group 1 truncated hemoglobin [Blastocatellia bacterium]|nr:group 1 truncated hemoglobin [Blastocatellia bacterium]